MKCNFDDNNFINDFDDDFEELKENVENSECDFDNNNNNNNNNNNKIFNKLDGIKNKLIFNIFNFQNKFDFNQINNNYTNIQIFNSKTEIERNLKNLIYFSYRINMNFKYKNEIFNTDSGWGCMIRCYQMILSKAIMKLYKIEKKVFFKKFLILFLDLILNEKIIIEKNLIGFKKYLKIEKKKVFFPLFSLPFLSKYNLNKFFFPGKFFSNNILSEIFCDIFNKFEPFENVNFFNFNSIVNLNDLITKNFSIAKCNCIEKDYEIIEKDEFIIDFEKDEKIIFVDKKISNKNYCECLKKTLKIEIINKNNEKKIFFDENYYKFNKKFILFINFREGYEKIEKSKCEKILNFFDYKSNIGFLSGNKNRAFYFVGKFIEKNNKNLIFLDPHFVQENINLNDFFNFNLEKLKSFETEKFHFINVENISPSFTLGFSFENFDDFIDFIEKSNCKIEENSLEKKYYLKFNLDNFINFKYDKNITSENIIKLTLIK